MVNDSPEERGGYFLPRGGRPLARTRMKLLESLVRLRVGKPFASWPNGETRIWRPPPPLDLPWPQPVGCSHGFMAIHTTPGLGRAQRCLSALHTATYTAAPT